MASAGHALLQQRPQIANRIRTLTNPELKEICKANGYQVSGTKSVLQTRCLEILDDLVARGDALGFESLRYRAENRGATPPQTYSNSPANYHSSPNYHNYNMPAQRSGVGPPNQNRMPAGRNYFKASPFYEMVDTLLPLQDLPEGPEMPQNRHTVRSTLTIPAETGEKFRRENLKILMYCGIYHSMSPFSAADVTFPNQIEVKVNDNDVKANFKGLKNKPGSTKPADITGFVRKYQGQSNTIQITYALTTKRYAFVVYLVRYVSADRLVERIKKHNVIRKQKVLEAMEKANADPDIAATSIRMSLKDPISTMRITLPVRSSHCTHNQCFDGAMFLQLQEQAPQWSCPICTKSTPFESLCVDEYFQEILDKTSKSIEKVDLEPNGEWKVIKDEDEDEANGTSSKARASYDDDFDDLIELEQPTNKQINGVKRDFSQTSLPSPISGPSFSINTPPLSSREPSVAQSASSAQRSNKRPQGAVIDLTLSDDEEEQPPRPAKRQTTANNRSLSINTNTNANTSNNNNNTSSPAITNRNINVNQSTTNRYNSPSDTRYQAQSYPQPDTFRPASNYSGPTDSYRPPSAYGQAQPPRFNTQSMSPPNQQATPAFGQSGWGALHNRPPIQHHNSGSSSYSTGGNFTPNSPFAIRPPPPPDNPQNSAYSALHRPENASYSTSHNQQNEGFGTPQAQTTNFATNTNQQNSSYSATPGQQSGLALPPISAGSPFDSNAFNGGWRSDNFSFDDYTSPGWDGQQDF